MPHPYSSRIRSSASAALTSVDDAEEKGYEHLPPLDESVAAHLCPPTAIGWKARASHPSKLCRATFALVCTTFRQPQKSSWTARQKEDGPESRYSWTTPQAAFFGCRNATVLDKLCSPEVGLMLLKCRLFYLLKEFTAVHICAVYIPPDANAKLVLLAQDCFHRTTWDVFKGEGTFTCESLDEYIASMLYYINFCVDSVTSWKPWMTHNVQQLIRARNIAYRSGDANAYSLARTALRKVINAAKLYHKRRIEANLSNCTKPRQVWEGIKSITDYKITFTSPSESSGATLAEELNIFYSCFDRENTDPELPPLLTIDPAPVLNTRGVRLVFCSIKPRKAAGPGRSSEGLCSRFGGCLHLYL